MDCKNLRQLPDTARGSGFLYICKVKNNSQIDFLSIKEKYEEIHTGQHVVKNDYCPFVQTGDCELCPLYT